ncbi:hypothetical protein [Muricoccus nepalensis]|uniref:hypothetical protein n=1 Tax=Muricoccus nepalensis TaxID=1854500 RepID=UPI001F4F2F52|nr:hypothetical protein [Roseomonas nepalensis]
MPDYLLRELGGGGGGGGAAGRIGLRGGRKPGFEPPDLPPEPGDLGLGLRDKRPEALDLRAH